jgi:hypothetical protein
MEIAAAAVALLAPYLAKAASSAAEKAGEATLDGVRALFDLVRRRFDADGDEAASSKLTALEESPEDDETQAALARVLSEKVESDPAFAEKLREAVAAATGGRSVGDFNTEVHGDVQGGIKNVNMGDVQGGVRF